MPRAASNEPLETYGGTEDQLVMKPPPDPETKSVGPDLAESIWLDTLPVALVAPVAPTGPVAPVEPVAPIPPVAPVGPMGLTDPVAPTGPVAPTAPSAPVDPTAPACARLRRDIGGQGRSGVKREATASVSGRNE